MQLKSAALGSLVLAVAACTSGSRGGGAEPAAASRDPADRTEAPDPDGLRLDAALAALARDRWNAVLTGGDGISPWRGVSPGVLPRPQIGSQTGIPLRDDLPFDPSAEDRPSLGAGFTGARKAPADSGFDQAIGLVVMDDRPLARAGLETGDLLLEIAGVRFPADDGDPVGSVRTALEKVAPETEVGVTYWRKDDGVRTATVTLGRAAPAFNPAETPESWFAAPPEDPQVRSWIHAALALDGGEARYEDTLRRNRERMAKTDWFRLPEIVQAHLHPAGQERLAMEVTDGLRASALFAPYVAAGRPALGTLAPRRDLSGASVEQIVDEIEAALVALDAFVDTTFAPWNAEERALLKTGFARLSERMAEGEYVNDDTDVERERTNRRVLHLLSQVDRGAVLVAAGRAWALVDSVLPHLARAAHADGRDGLLLARDTAAGRIEVWGGASQRHGNRCLFRFDLWGNDTYVDVGARADLDQPVSIQVDWGGHDLYGGTSPGCQASAFGGVAILVDLHGDDQYLARQWSQGVGVAGVGILLDAAGDDTYRALDMCQGVGFVGGGVVVDLAGRDVYSGDRFCQGIGFAAGVGAVVDHEGDDRYACTGRYVGEYGDAGIFSGWGQGCGFGQRHITSGGIGALVDLAGDDIYEAGNFSQGGGYFYAWGILRDDAGDDRYIGSRYAQGFAAHQAEGTFLEGGGNDRYQSHWGVAQGLSWDETTVVFRDRGGNDTYESTGFSRAAAAHNAVAILIDDSGDDDYATLPGQAGSNGYHGGNSFSLFVDLGGGLDLYGGVPWQDWNDRVAWKEEGAYHFDLPARPGAPTEYVRQSEADR